MNFLKTRNRAVGTGGWGNGKEDDYMQVGDLVAVLNMPDDGLFTICRITGDYYFDIPGGARRLRACAGRSRS